MFKKTVLITLELLGIQIVAFMFSFFFFIGVIPLILYSTFTGLLFIWALHSTFWQLGNKDGKMNTILNNHLSQDEPRKKNFLLKGALLALPHFIINIIFVIYTTKYNNSDLMTTVQSFALFPLIGFIRKFESSGMSSFSANAIGCLIMYIPCCTAYISGIYNISIIEKIFPKILYKSSNNTNNKTKN